jgi:transcriptional repressor NrdR
MECPRCERQSRVLESRRSEGGAAIRRRRECSACGHRFTTFERRAPEPLYVLKRDGTRERFARNKLRAALLRATHKRQVEAEQVESLVTRVELAIAGGGGELDAQRVGELCLEGLREIDHGAYLQFLGTLPVPEGERTPHFAESSEPSSVRSTRDSSSLPAETG